MSVLSESQVRSNAAAAGFTGQALDYIVAIARRESGFNPGAYNGDESTGDNSVGLTQINMIGDLGRSRLNQINQLFGANLQTVDQAKAWLKDPANNLKYAYYISNQGTNFQPWTTAAGALADIGGVPLPGGSGGGSTATSTTSAPDPQATATRKQLSDAVNTAFAAYQSNQSAVNFQNWHDAISALSEWDAAQADIDTSKFDNDPAQRAFDNAIKQGDLDRQTADSKYQAWADKQKMAADAAGSELTAIDNANKESQSEADNFFKTNGQGPRSNIATFYTKPYQDVLAKYQSKYGADGAAPSLDIPDRTSGIGAGNGGGGDETSAGPYSLNFNEALPTPPQPPVGPPAFNTAPMDDGKWYTLGPDGTHSVQPTGDKGDQPQEPSSNPFIRLGQAEIDALPTVGRVAGKTADVLTGMPGLSATAAGVGNAWWRNLGSPVKSKIGGLLGFKGGTANYPGGPAVMNEAGEETVAPAFGAPYTLPGGPQVHDPGAGAAVIPADVPRDQAFLYSQIRQAAAKGPQGPDTSPQAQAARANDPQLMDKVRQALLSSIAAVDALHPPSTPTMLHDGEDLWANWRGLTGKPAVPPQPAEAK